MNTQALFTVIISSLIFFGIGQFLPKQFVRLLKKISPTTKLNEVKLSSFFKKFHLILAVLVLIIFGGLIIGQVYLPYITLLIGFIIFSYSIFFFRAFALYKNKVLVRIGLILLTISILIIGTLLKKYKDNLLDFKNKAIIINSKQGARRIDLENLKSIALIAELPPFQIENDGNYILKDTNNGNKVLLFINSNQTPVIEFSTFDSLEIFYSAPYLKNEYHLEILKDKIAAEK